MISILYDVFKKWSATGSVYIISDPHFLDAESFEFRKASGKLPKDIDTIEKLAEYQIKKINEVCHKNDCLICLGDVGDTDCVRRLKAGYKVLILGNHDGGADRYKHRIEAVVAATGQKRVALMNTWDATYLKMHQQDLSSYKELKLFDEIYSGPLMISDKILLSHEPIIPCPDYIVNLCGHVHARKHKFKVNKHLYYNFCSEAIDYTPASLADLIKNGLLSKVKDIHEVTVAGAVERKKLKNRD